MEGKRLPNASLHGHVREKQRKTKEEMDGQC